MKDARLSVFLKELEDIPGFTDFSNISPNTVNTFGETPLHVAAVRGDLPMIHLLIEAGADPNFRGEHGYTPLHEAATQGHHSVVDALLDSGASPDILTDDGWSHVELLQSLHPKKAEQGS